MIFLPRFKDTTLRASQGQTSYADLRSQLKTPDNLPKWANVNVDGIPDANLQSTWDSFQGYRNTQANRQMAANQTLPTGTDSAATSRYTPTSMALGSQGAFASTPPVATNRMPGVFSTSSMRRNLSQRNRPAYAGAQQRLRSRPSVFGS